MTSKQIIYQERHKALGLCTKCQNETTRGRVLCDKHRLIDNKSRMKRYYRNKQAKLCVQCNNPSGGFIRCITCRSKYHKKYYDNKEKGLCFCGRIAVKNKVQCARCVVQNKARRNGLKIGKVLQK